MLFIHFIRRILFYMAESFIFSDREKIWVPKLGFTNALGPYQTLIDEFTNGLLIREANPMREDEKAAIEGDSLDFLVTEIT